MKSNLMKYRLNTKSGTLCKTFSLLTKVVIEWQLHASLPYTMIDHYKPNECFFIVIRRKLCSQGTATTRSRAVPVLSFGSKMGQDGGSLTSVTIGGNWLTPMRKTLEPQRESLNPQI
jgi:hypothetical protein